MPMKTMLWLGAPGRSSRRDAAHAIDLLEDLVRGEVPDEAHRRGRAEGASVGAAHLRGDAQRVLRALRHLETHRLDALAVGEAPEVLRRVAGARRRRALLDERAHVERGARRLAERDRQIRHLCPVVDAAPVDPLENLAGAVGLLVAFGKERHELMGKKPHDVGTCVFGGQTLAPLRAAAYHSAVGRGKACLCGRLRRQTVAATLQPWSPFSKRSAILIASRSYASRPVLRTTSRLWQMRSASPSRPSHVMSAYSNVPGSSRSGGRDAAARSRHPRAVPPARSGSFSRWRSARERPTARSPMTAWPILARRLLTGEGRAPRSRATSKTISSNARNGG